MTAEKAAEKAADGSSSEDGTDKTAKTGTPSLSFLRPLSSFFRLLFYADPTWVDVALLVVGTVCAAAAGTPFPLMGILFGQLVDDINGATCEAETGGSSYEYEGAVNQKVLLVVYAAIAALVLIYVYIVSWSVLGQRLAERLRDRYLRGVLRQEPAFFDQADESSSGAVSARLQGDIETVRSGTSEKVGIVIASASFFVTAYIIAFIKQPRLAGMLVSLIPAFLLMSVAGGTLAHRFSTQMSAALDRASSVAAEALEHVGVVQVFGAGPRLSARFESHLAVARAAGLRKAFATAAQAGLLYFLAYSANALAYWQGSKLVVQAGGGSVGSVYTVVFILVDACVVLGNVAPMLPLLGGAAAAFERLRGDMERESLIDGTSDSGEQPPVNGAGIDVALDSVSFAYASRPGQTVLNHVSLAFPAGRHTAIVGPSGSGKSTIAALVGRLRDPTDGVVRFGGVDARQLNVRGLRGLVGVVQQEPALLSRSVLENIALGLVGSPRPEHAHLKEVLMGPQLAELAAQGRGIPEAARRIGGAVAEVFELVQRAAELADAAEFVERLELGYGTATGAGGLLLSGGQRQRVALARALVRDPRVLLLDEATASLDSASERRIQAAVERAAGGRTVISIAHRLSTVRGADNIVVLRAGEVVEQGGYDELMARGDEFYRMASLQAVDRGGKEIDKQDDMDDETDEKSVTDHVHESGPSPEPSVDIEALPLGRTLASVSRLVRPSLAWIAAALLAATVVGGTFPSVGVVLGFTVAALNPCANSPDRILELGRFFAGLLFMLAVVELAANFVAWWGFGVVAERLLFSMRSRSLRALLAKPVDWHQSGGRSASGLLGLVTRDSAAVAGFGGSVAGTVFSVLVSLVAAVVLSHILAWKIALVCLVVVPLLVAAGLLQLRQLARFEERHAAAYASAASLAVEAVAALPTVAALSLEPELSASYARTLRAARRDVVAQSAKANVWLALSNSLGFLVYAFAYWWGAHLIMGGEYSQRQFFTILVAMLVSAQLWGQMFTLAPEFSRAGTAAQRIMGVIKDEPRDKNPDIEAVAESTPPAPDSPVSIAFDRVSFSYAARPDVPVLRDVSFSIRPGQFCGLVGPSGAGKSTIMKLVQGAYAATSGSVSVDGLDPASSRSFSDSVAIVPQDCALFDGSVKFNVGLGARPGVEASDADIEEACRLAGVHDVVAALPRGYDTECGPRARQLSGGQRQRLSIARALVRKPRLLLLDESTSALDAESERVLQESLELVARHATVVAITHRLHTVRRADVILVVEGGRVVARGTHQELMESSESYRKNAQQQVL